MNIIKWKLLQIKSGELASIPLKSNDVGKIYTISEDGNIHIMDVARDRYPYPYHINIEPEGFPTNFDLIYDIASKLQRYEDKLLEAVKEQDLSNARAYVLYLSDTEEPVDVFWDSRAKAYWGFGSFYLAIFIPTHYASDIPPQ